jgi:hypothetical protein
MYCTVEQTDLKAIRMGCASVYCFTSPFHQQMNVTEMQN